MTIDKNTIEKIEKIYNMVNGLTYQEMTDIFGILLLLIHHRGNPLFLSHLTEILNSFLKKEKIENKKNKTH